MVRNSAEIWRTALGRTEYRTSLDVVKEGANGLNVRSSRVKRCNGSRVWHEAMSSREKLPNHYMLVAETRFVTIEYHEHLLLHWAVYSKPKLWCRYLATTSRDATGLNGDERKSNLHKALVTSPKCLGQKSLESMASRNDAAKQRIISHMNNDHQDSVRVTYIYTSKVCLI